MSKRFPCQCPRAKQIVGAKQWIGWAQAFAFPGFKGNWVNSYGESGEYTGGAWQATADGGAISPPATEWNFAVGDLVVQEFRAEGPFTDYLTGLSQSYPKYYQVYLCQAAITGSATRPSDDSTHFVAWDYQPFYVNAGGQLIWGGGAGAYHDGTPDPGGPSGWPAGAVAPRAVFSSTTDTANLELTVTTELDNFPLYPATLSGLIAKIAGANDTAAAFNDPACPEASASGTFVYDWTFANNYDGTPATSTPPATTPSTGQAGLIFPNLPLRRSVGYAPSGHWDGGAYVLDSVFVINPSPPATYLPGLVSWNCSSSSITFKFAAWSWATSVEYSFDLDHFGDQATAPGTITQTLVLGGSSYSLSEVASQAATLMAATPFASIAWGTSWTNTYNTSGGVVSTQNLAASVATAITASCKVGTELKWAAAINGCPFVAGESGYFMTKALVDVCGNYCQRTYNCPTVTCVNGNVDGYAPIEIDPPATAGQSVGIYPGCQCG
jgi:hypothetical protein